MTLPTVDEVIDADRPTLKHFCKLYGLPVKGKNRYLRARLFELIRLGRAKQSSIGSDFEKNGLPHIRTALHLASKGETDRAMDELDQAIGACPESGLSLIAKSLLLDQAGEKVEAEKLSEEATRFEESEEVLLGRVLVLLSAGMWDDAEDAADALSKKLQGPVPWLLKALATIPAGRAGLAVQYLDEALEADNQIPELWNLKGEIVVRLGNYGNSLPCFDKALDLRRNYAEAYNNKGVALLHLGHIEDALSCFDRALEKRSEYPEALSNKAVALHLLGEGTQSIKLMEKAIEETPSAEFWNNKGQILLSLELYEDALTAFDKALDLDEDSAEARQGRQIALEKSADRRLGESFAKPAEVLEAAEAGDST